MKHEPCRYTLSDDGSLDTLVVIECTCGRRRTERFDDESSVDYRHPDTGALDGWRFDIFVDEVVVPSLDWDCEGEGA